MLHYVIERVKSWEKIDPKVGEERQTLNFGPFLG